MKRNAAFAVVLSSVLLIGAHMSHAADWVRQNYDIPNKSVDANFYDGSSVKVHNKTLSWTEKFILTDFGVKHYTKHLSKFKACQENITKKGDAAYHQLDFEIKGGKFRVVAKRNYNKNDVLLCTDKDMGAELDKTWQEIIKGSPMYERYYTLATKYKVGDI